jgi:uncharacterized protein YndB with AHSA1/START domain/uncharacterized protein YciI
VEEVRRTSGGLLGSQGGWRRACLIALTSGMTLATPRIQANDENAERPGERVLKLETTIRAALPRVWHAWTTEQGITAFGPETASIDLRLGGKYEWYFSQEAPEGSRGSEGCTIVSYIPMEMLAFTWNAPPSIPNLREAQARTQVVLRFTRAGDGAVKVSLTQLGFGRGEDWDKYYEYFSRAWPRVLDRQKEYLESKSQKPAADPSDAVNRETAASDAPSPSSSNRPPDAADIPIYYAVLLRRGPNWPADSASPQAAHLQAHKKYMVNLFESGATLLGGPYPDLSGAVLILTADDAAQAEKLIASDPAVRHKLFQFEIRPFYAALRPEARR